MLPSFPEGLIELVVLHPIESNTFVWKDVPDVVLAQAEMSFYNGTEVEDAYEVYGVDVGKGAIAIVRPDGYIGVVTALADTDRIKAYLSGCIREVSGFD